MSKAQYSETNRQWLTATKEACAGNLNGYLYALIKIEEESTVPLLDYSEDTQYHLNNHIEYIGITNNPIARLADHKLPRAKDTKKIGMMLFGFPENPAEGKMMEATAIHNYCLIKGKSPNWQKGTETWSGA